MKFFSNTVIVTIGGVLLVVLGLFHLTFWDLFDWGNELPKLSKGNSSLVQMMAICTVCYLNFYGAYTPCLPERYYRIACRQIATIIIISIFHSQAYPRIYIP
jgi:hypothetical protein